MWATWGRWAASSAIPFGTQVVMLINLLTTFGFQYVPKAAGSAAGSILASWVQLISGSGGERRDLVHLSIV